MHFLLWSGFKFKSRKSRREGRSHQGRQKWKNNCESKGMEEVSGDEGEREEWREEEEGEKEEKQKVASFKFRI